MVEWVIGDPAPVVSASRLPALPTEPFSDSTDWHGTTHPRGWPADPPCSRVRRWHTSCVSCFGFCS